jgi:WD40 repeat protein
VSSVAFASDGHRVITASVDRTARIWAIGDDAVTFDAPSPDLYMGAFTPDGAHLLTVGGPTDNQVVTWDLQGRRLGALKAPLGHGDLNGVVLSPDGERAALPRSDGTTQIMELASGRELRSLSSADDHGNVVDAAFDAHGDRVATAGEDGARVWDARSGERLLALATGNTTSAEFSPDGARLLVANVVNVKLWRIDTGAVDLALDEPYGAVWAVFSRDGTRVATAGADGRARIWSLAGGSSPTLFEGHTAQLQAIELSPDGALLLTGSIDRTARIWEAPEGRPVDVKDGFPGPVTAVSFSRDGKRIATLGGGRVRIWELRQETRTPAEISRLVACKVPFRVSGGRLTAHRGGTCADVP